MKLNRETEKQVVTVEESSLQSELHFNELVVYQEMADQTSQRVNLLEQINDQFRQIDEVLERRKFLLKEVFHEVVKG